MRNLSFCILLYLGMAAYSYARCGHTFNPVGGWRIVGGKYAEKGNWPWIVLFTLDGQTWCGGSIISNRWIISAAHCFKGMEYNVERFLVGVGDHNLMENEPATAVHRVERIILEPHYTGQVSSDQYDIAMIKVEGRIEFNSRVQTVCLPEPTDTFSQQNDCWAAGWGDTRGLTQWNILQHHNSRTVSNQECDRAYVFASILPGHICWGLDWRGTCNGDSGGPLVCREGDIFKLAGVVSFGSQDCLESGFPNVFSRVTSHLDWIHQTMLQN